MGRFELSEFLSKRTADLRTAIDARVAADLASRPVDDLVDEYVEQFDLEPPVIHWDLAEQAEPTESTATVPAQFAYSPFPDVPKNRTVAATRVEVAIPVSGTVDLLGSYSSRRYLDRDWKQTAIHNSELIVWNTWTQPTEERIQKWWESERSMIQRQLSPVLHDLQEWRTRLPEVARMRVEHRRSRIELNQGLESALGLPVRRRDQGPRPIPVARKKVGVARSQRADRRRSAEIEYTLDYATYLEVLELVSAFGRGLTRSPRLARKYSEEELRDQILIHLNGHFQGAAGGELFNGEGRTDILIRHRDRSVFIGECKIWHGQKKLVEAIDQLDRYLIWHDTKSAIVLFIKARDATAIIDKAGESIRSHPRFKRDGPAAPRSEDYANFVLSHGDDKDREIALALIPVIVRPEGDIPDE